MPRSSIAAVLAAAMGVVALSGCVLAPPSPEVPDLVGTEWEGTGHDGDRLMLRFEPDGRVYYEAPTRVDTTPDDDTWLLEGDVVTIALNGGYATYEGTIDGSTMAGTAENDRATWDWAVERVD